MAVTGKVILKVKSGPGTLIGETEMDIIDDTVSFKNLKFDQPGDYVISVTSTSTFVEFSEFAVKILPETIEIEQPETKTQEEDKKPEEKPKPIITQVDQPKVDLPPMELPNTQNLNDDKKVASQVGLTPFINYMGSPINDRDIKFLRLSHNGIIPVIEFIFNDTNGIIKNIGMPQDDTKFEFFLNSRSPNIKSIHLKFKIEDFTTLSKGQYSIYGTLDISGLYRIKYQPYTGTSYEVLREIAKELKLGFNSNITNTDDKMIWRNVGDKQYQFIEKIIKHSYISDKSFMVGFIDYYYCFNYVDVDKELKRSNANDKYIDTSSFDDGGVKDTEKIQQLILSSDKSLNTSASFIEEKNFENNSTSISLEKGYKTKTKYYDKTKKEFLVFDVDSTTSDESTTMILKGALGDKEAFQNHISTVYTGKIDTDNVHKNYNYAITQNKINLDEINKVVLTVDLPNPNYSIYMYQKVNVTIVNPVPSPSDPQMIQWRKSGDYIISEMNFNWNGRSLKQELRLMRKELGKNPKEINEGPPPAEKTPADVKNPENTNPTDDIKLLTPIAPVNSTFTVGDIYTIEDSNKARYFANITNVLENGIEVTAKLSSIEKQSDGTYLSKTIDADYLFNVEKTGFMNNTILGEVSIIGKGEIYENVSTEEEDLSEYVEEGFEGSEELAIQLEALQDIQLLSLPDSTPTSESTARIDDLNIDFNSPNYVGGKWKSFNIDKLISLLSKSYQPNSKFRDSLKKVLYFIKNDASINDVRKAAYLLGTAFAESGYSLQRWEADYACTGAGVPYGSNGPCSSALNYYRSTKGGKKNYYNLGTDSKGFPYFGRGLIQLTGKANYEKYGTKIGVNLAGNGDLALDPQNSYKIAIEFMKARTFSKVINGDLTAARKSVNGGTKGINEVNGAYKAWLEAFDKISKSA